MKALSEQDFYELLEVEPDVGAEALRKALARARRTWCDNVGAAYSLLDDDERAQITERLQEAESLLFDHARRAAYNRELGLGAPPEPPAQEGARPPLVLAEEPEEETQHALFPRPQAPAVAKVIGITRRVDFELQVPISEPEPEPAAPSAHVPTLPSEADWPEKPEPARKQADPGKFFSGPADCTGANLRKYREACGRNLQDIARETKVTRTHLENMEAEDWALLPALIYVRGFLQGYCRELGLDSKLVCEGYLARFKAARGE